MMEFYSLGSSSRGNAFLIRTGTDHWLIDAGLSAAEITRELHGYNLTPDRLAGIWITHEHIDHVRGLGALLRRAPVPVFISPRCLAASGMRLPRELVIPIQAGEVVSAGAAEIRVRAKYHDAADPLFFTFVYAQRAVSIITDLGFACDNVLAAVAESDGLILEANHDPAMLIRGPYPLFLQRRVSGDHGHLSNYQAADLLIRAATPRLRHVLLAHISRTNNTDATALKTILDALSARPGASLPRLYTAPHCGGTTPIKL